MNNQLEDLKLSISKMDSLIKEIDNAKRSLGLNLYEETVPKDKLIKALSAQIEVNNLLKDLICKMMQPV